MKGQLGIVLTSLLLGVFTGGCATTSLPPDFTGHWTAQPLDSAVSALGIPHRQSDCRYGACIGDVPGDTLYTDWYLNGARGARCRFSIVSSADTVVEAEASGGGCLPAGAWVVESGLMAAHEYARECSLLEIDGCLTPDSMLALGLVELPSTTGVTADYARFYETYRFATNPQSVVQLQSSDFQVAFVALFDKEAPYDVFYAALFLAADVESLWAGPRNTVDEGPLAIPQTETEVGTGRLLIDDDSPRVLQAVRQLPVNIPTPSPLILTLPARTMERLSRAESAELLLPSGTTFRFSPELLNGIKNLVNLVVWPDWAVDYAEGGALPR